jgi:hypothetical protein
MTNGMPDDPRKGWCNALQMGGVVFNSQGRLQGAVCQIGDDNPAQGLAGREKWNAAVVRNRNRCGAGSLRSGAGRF